MACDTAVSRIWNLNSTLYAFVEVLDAQCELKVIEILTVKTSLGLFFSFFPNQRQILIANAQFLALQLAAKKGFKSANKN